MCGVWVCNGVCWEHDYRAFIMVGGRSHHRTRRKSGNPERLASLFPLLEMAKETYSSSAPPARRMQVTHRYTGAYHAVCTLKGGERLAARVSNGI